MENVLEISVLKNAFTFYLDLFATLSKYQSIRIVIHINIQNLPQKRGKKRPIEKLPEISKNSNLRIPCT